MASSGGTAVPEKRSAAPWVGFIVVAIAAAYLVHQLSSGDSCGWNYSAVGGACRAIILLSIISGLVAGALAATCIRAASNDNRGRAMVYGIVVVVAIVLGTLAAKQFEDYRDMSHHYSDLPQAG
jgi:hypothetical protein